MRILLVLTMAASLAPAADQSLLNLVMPEAKVLMGVDVDRARDSVFGRFVLSQIGKEDAALGKMTGATGFVGRYIVDHCCPVKGRTRSAGWKGWGGLLWDRCAKRGLKSGFSRRASDSESVE